MLKKENRLPRSKLESIKSFPSAFFKIRTSDNGSDKSRFGFVVSKKIDKRAVVRNRIKRRTRSVIEELLPKIEKGHDFLFFAKKEVTKSKRKEIFEDLRKAFEKEKLIK